MKRSSNKIELRPYDLSASRNSTPKDEFRNPHYKNGYDLSNRSSKNKGS